MYLIGRINSTFGLKGELKLKNQTDFDRFYKGAKVFLKNGTLLEIENVRSGKNFDIIKFKNYNDIDEARLIANNNLYTDEEPELEQGQYTYQELIGIDCYDIDNNFIGKIKDILFLPSQEVLKIDVNGKIKMVPFVDEFIKEVQSEKIIIKPIEGLL